MVSRTHLCPRILIALPKVTEAAKQIAPSQLSNHLFDLPDAQEEPCSLPPALLDTISMQKPTWANFAGENFRLAAMRWLCALHYDAEFQQIEASCPSLMPEIGWVLRNITSDQIVLVIRESKWGFIGLQVESRETRGLSIVTAEVAEMYGPRSHRCPLHI